MAINPKTKTRSRPAETVVPERRTEAKRERIRDQRSAA
jgi:hypothetical protein